MVVLDYLSKLSVSQQFYHSRLNFPIMLYDKNPASIARSRDSLRFNSPKIVSAFGLPEILDDVGGGRRQSYKRLLQCTVFWIEFILVMVSIFTFNASEGFNDE